jgi:hypothetical protein
VGIAVAVGTTVTVGMTVTVTDGVAAGVEAGVGVDTFLVWTAMPGPAVGDAPGKYAVGPTLTVGAISCAVPKDDQASTATATIASAATDNMPMFLSFTSLTG